MPRNLKSDDITYYLRLHKFYKPHIYTQMHISGLCACRNVKYLLEHSDNAEWSNQCFMSDVSSVKKNLISLSHFSLKLRNRSYLCPVLILGSFIYYHTFGAVLWKHEKLINFFVMVEMFCLYQSESYLSGRRRLQVGFLQCLYEACKSYMKN